MFSQEQVKEMALMLSAMGFVGSAAGVKVDGGGNRRVLDERNFRRMGKFGGEGDKWNEWIFNLKVAVGAVSKECRDGMVAVMDGELVEDGLDAVEGALTGKGLETSVREKYGQELFEVLCWLTEGEANMVVRRVVLKQGEQCGFMALRMLAKRFNLKTPARMLQHLGEIIRPGIVKDIKALPRMVEEWEAKVGRFESEYEKVGEGVKLAVLVSVLPKDLQDMIFQMGSREGKSKQVEYQEVRDKVMSVAGNRIQMATRCPMDVGAVGGYGGEEEWYGEGDEGGWIELEEGKGVESVGKGGGVWRSRGLSRWVKGV